MPVESENVSLSVCLAQLKTSFRVRRIPINPSGHRLLIKTELVVILKGRITIRLIDAVGINPYRMFIWVFAYFFKEFCDLFVCRNGHCQLLGYRLRVELANGFKLRLGLNNHLQDFQEIASILSFIEEGENVSFAHLLVD